MRHKCTTIVLAILCTSASLVHAAGTVNFVGVRSCGEWFSNKSSYLLKSNQESWLLGYLSGLASVTGKDFITGTENSTLFQWVDDFCRAKPIEEIDSAANEIARKLIGRKGL